MSEPAAHDPAILRTERLILRPHRLGDLDAVADLWSDPRVVEFVMPGPLPRSEAWNRLLRYVGHWALLPFGYWAVIDRATGRFAGEVGFADWKREISPSIEGHPEMGWAIAPEFQGRGFAREAIDAALRWVDGRPEIPEAVALINPIHAVSIALARKVGFGPPSEAPFRGATILMLRRDRGAGSPS